MEATRKPVIFIVKLGSGVKFCHDDLNAGHIFTWMHVDRHAAAIVTYLERAIFVIDDIDPIGESGDRLINGIIYDLLCQMIRPRSIGIHAGSASDRIKPLQHF
jgi:hypothetical protein